MKSIVLFFFVIGIVMLAIGYQKKLLEDTNVEKVIEYRYIPRNIYDEQYAQNNLECSFSDMFKKNSVYFYANVTDDDNLVCNKSDNLNVVNRNENTYKPYNASENYGSYSGSYSGPSGYQRPFADLSHYFPRNFNKGNHHHHPHAEYDHFSEEEGTESEGAESE